MNKTSTVDSEELAKFSQLAAEWWNPEGPLKTLHDLNPTRLAFIKRYIRLPQLSILDVGCGGGILAEALSEGGAKVTGLDVEEEAILAARHHNKDSGHPVKYVCQPIETFISEPYDAITCMEMLEHVANPSLIIEHSARLLKPGGYLFLSTINRTVKAYGMAVIAAEYILGLLPKQTHDYKKFIKPSELAAMARSYGLTQEGISGLGYNPFQRKAYLQTAVDVNYLAVYQKPAL